MTFAQLLAFGTGALLLGVALALGGIFALASNTCYEDNGSGCSGCLGLVICLIGLSVAVYFFSLAFSA